MAEIEGRITIISRTDNGAILAIGTCFDQERKPGYVTVAQAQNYAAESAAYREFIRNEASTLLFEAFRDDWDRKQLIETLITRGKIRIATNMVLTTI